MLGTTLYLRFTEVVHRLLIKHSLFSVYLFFFILYGNQTKPKGLFGFCFLKPFSVLKNNEKKEKKENMFGS